MPKGNSHHAFSFRSGQRLRSTREYQTVFAGGRFTTAGWVSARALPNGRPFARLGLRVGKRQVKRAVDRHRIVRCIREHFRTRQHQLGPRDVVVWAKKGAGALDRPALHRALTNLFQRLAIAQ